MDKRLLTTGSPLYIKAIDKNIIRKKETLIEFLHFEAIIIVTKIFVVVVNIS